jgi:ATP-dependent DNA helicase RecG
MQPSKPIDFLDTPIVFVKGIGPQRAEVLQKELFIFTYRDLISHYPFRYVDRTKFHAINEIVDENMYYQIRGSIDHMELIGEKRTKRLVVKFKDISGSIDLVWFQGYKWMAEKLKLGVEYIVYGKPTQFKGRFNIAHPDIEIASQEYLAAQSSFQAVYHSTEKLKYKGLDSEGIRRAMRQLMSFVNETNILESLPETLISDFKLIPRYEAIKQIHFPDSKTLLDKAIFRLKFEELFFVQLKILRTKTVRQQEVHGFVFNKVGDVFNTFYNQYLSLIYP